MNREYRGPSGRTALELVLVTEGSAVELLERLRSVKKAVLEKHGQGIRGIANRGPQMEPRAQSRRRPA